MNEGNIAVLRQEMKQGLEDITTEMRRGFSEVMASIRNSGSLVSPLEVRRSDNNMTQISNASSNTGTSRDIELSNVESGNDNSIDFKVNVISMWKMWHHQHMNVKTGVALSPLCELTSADVPHSKAPCLSKTAKVMNLMTDIAVEKGFVTSREDIGGLGFAESELVCRQSLAVVFQDYCLASASIEATGRKKRRKTESMVCTTIHNHLDLTKVKTRLNN